MAGLLLEKFLHPSALTAFAPLAVTASYNTLQYYTIRCNVTQNLATLFKTKSALTAFALLAVTEASLCSTELLSLASPHRPLHHPLHLAFANHHPLHQPLHLSFAPLSLSLASPPPKPLHHPTNFNDFAA